LYSHFVLNLLPRLTHSQTVEIFANSFGGVRCGKLLRLWRGVQRVKLPGLDHH
jgi:hypothetical protein